MSESLFNKVTGLQAHDIKKRLQHRCFPVASVAKSLRTPTYFEKRLRMAASGLLINHWFPNLINSLYDGRITLEIPYIL